MSEFKEVDLFDMGKDDAAMSVFDQKTRNQDGIYRPSLTDVTDKTRGYRAKLRFVHNVNEEGKVGVPALEKHIHYADFKNEPNLAGYYDCEKNYKEKCPLCTIYWSLKNSKNQADVERSKLISRTTKYYSYVLVIEDEQRPELVGKILVFPYGFTIKEKIKAQRDGEIGDPCNVFDIQDGRDFQLIIKEKGGFPNYEASQFLESSPIKLWDEKNEKFITTPVDEDGKITDKKVQKKIMKVLSEKEAKMEDFAPKEWDEETTKKANDVVALLSGKDLVVTESSAKSASNDMSGKDEIVDDLDESEISSDDFFDDDED